MPITDLFDAERHEPLQASPWHDDAACAAVDRIVAAAFNEYQPDQGWLAHPLDDPDEPGWIDTPLYHGAGGVVLALRALARPGRPNFGQTLPDFSPLVATLRARNHARVAGQRHGTASLLLGDSGLDLLHWLWQPSQALADGLHDSIAGNLHNPVREALWGNPGTLLAAIWLAEATGEARWAALVRQGADALEAEMAIHPTTGTWVWRQDLYGRSQACLLGAAHGFVGNVFPFLRGAAWLPAEQVARVMDRALATLQATAMRADGGANWRPSVEAQTPGDHKRLVQDCHGAPGILCRLAAAPRSPAWDALLQEAGELTWQAGPLSKGPSLCHGTAGSALALQKLWRRSGDVRWRDRARALAMHAAGQVESARAQHSCGRHGLWTGDLGVACVLLALLDDDDRFPSLDLF